ncbi:MAG: hypothetical protein QOH10_2107 [Actinomycetota bacterium]|jgi:hypothetical protein|nr:hypothetical protein [Actinomycetota bacterium]
MYRCPTCVSLLVDATVRRCPVCGENFRRHPPKVLGADRGAGAKLTTWDMRAQSDASKLSYGRTSSGRTATAEHD